MIAAGRVLAPSPYRRYSRANFCCMRCISGVGKHLRLEGTDLPGQIGLQLLVARLAAEAAGGAAGEAGGVGVGALLACAGPGRTLRATWPPGTRRALASELPHRATAAAAARAAMDRIIRRDREMAANKAPDSSAPS
jgi:hypothetical protein